MCNYYILWTIVHGLYIFLAFFRLSVGVDYTRFNILRSLGEPKNPSMAVKVKKKRDPTVPATFCHVKLNRTAVKEFDVNEKRARM